MIPMDQKTVEWKVAAAERAAKEAGYDFPIAWALMFLHDHHEVLDARLYEPSDLKYIREELAKIVDWIMNGDPETRNEPD